MVYIAIKRLFVELTEYRVFTIAAFLHVYSIAIDQI